MTPDEIAASLFGGPTTITEPAEAEPVETEPVEAVQPETVEVKPDSSTPEGEKSPECEADTQTSLARRQRNLYSLGCVALGDALGHGCADDALRRLCAHHVALGDALGAWMNADDALRRLCAHHVALGDALGHG